MCGIIGYVGGQDAWPILLTGLTRLEYRGYDSAGIVTLHRKRLKRARAIGPLGALRRAQPDGLPGRVGIGHTRWATHGGVTVDNCHPHMDPAGQLAVVHNGILDNLDELTASLPDGARLVSQTDTELLAHLIAAALPDHAGDLLEATRDVLERVRGTAAIVVLHKDRPERLVAARLGSPLVVATSPDAALVASDVDALAGLATQAIPLDDGELVEIGPGHVRSSGLERRERAQRVAALAVPDPGDVDVAPDDVPLYWRELHEQPASLAHCVRGRLDRASATVRLDELAAHPDLWHRFDRAVLAGCGSSMHAASMGAIWLNRDARLPATVHDAAELLATNPIIEPRTLYLAISQSGETADVLSLVREVRLRGGFVLGVTNIVGSTLARESDACLFMHAGRERSVASTKSFTSQLAMLAMLTLGFGRARGMSPAQGRAWIDALVALPERVSAALALDPVIERIARDHAHAPMTMFIGRGAGWPLAREAALKLKELAYVACEGLSGAEMKHGPIALIEPGTPVLGCVFPDDMDDRMRGNLQELGARGAELNVLADPADATTQRLVERALPLEGAGDPTAAIQAIVPWHLYAYHRANLLGRTIDRPRNLAKSVTVE